MRNRTDLPIEALLLIVALAIPARANDKPKQNNTAPSRTDTAGGTPSVNPVGASYVIAPDDVLAIDVWKEAEITRTVPVRPDGKISLPLLNDVQAAGLTPSQLSAVISEGLKKFINS